MEKNTFKAFGEFEHQESVLMMWPLTPFATKTNEFNREQVAIDIVKALMGNVKIIISCYDEKMKERAIKLIKAENINVCEILFVVYPCEIIYPRDHGAEIMVDGHGNKRVISFDSSTYAMFGKGDAISRNLEAYAKFHSEQLGITEIIHSQLTSEGGDREFNGNGVMMTIEETEVNKRNPGWSKKDVEDEFKRIFNMEKVIWIKHGTYSDEHMYLGPIPDEHGLLNAYRSASANGHIDEMARFVSEDTIILAEITREEADKSYLFNINKQQLDAAYSILKDEKTLGCIPFKILRMPTPEPIYIDIDKGDDIFECFISASETYGGKMLDGSPFPSGKMKVLPSLSYCNFLITNNVVLAQKYYREGMSKTVKEKDEMASEILKQAFPDRRVIAIDSLPLNLYGGGIHCNTRHAPSGNC
ncbi:MAG: agmatine deiminase family protein [Bacillota bacterium]|nr:agmatine deiminase family protein [Bacillota bacterium]